MSTRSWVAVAVQATAAALLLGCSSSPREVTPWSKQFGVSGQQDLHSIAVGPDGQVALAGSFTRQISLGGGSLDTAGSQDVFVGVLDDTGGPLWSGRTGSSGNQIGKAVGVASNGDVVLAGSFTGKISFGDGELDATSQSVFVARFDPFGKARWSQKFGDAQSPGVFFTGFAVAPDGSSVMSGFFVSQVTFGSTTLTEMGQGAFLAKLDAEGNVVYALDLGNNCQINSVAVDASGAAVFGGVNIATIDFGGKTFNGDSNGFAAKVDAAGNPLWLAQFGGAFSGPPTSAAVDGAGNVFLAGSFNSPLSFGDMNFPPAGYTDLFVAKLSGDGQPVWLKTFGHESSSVFPEAAVADAKGHVLVLGEYNGSIDFGGGTFDREDYAHTFLLELDAQGSHVASQRFGGPVSEPGNTLAGALALDPAGGVVVGGNFSGDLVAGGVTMTSHTSEDIFLIRQKR